MVGGGVDEDSTLIPGSTLHSDVLMNVTETLPLTVTDHDGCETKVRLVRLFTQRHQRLIHLFFFFKLTVFSQQSHVASVGTPHHVLDLGDFDGGQRAFLLHVEQRDAVGIPQQQ